MNLSIIHPEQQSLTVIESTIDNGGEIFRSPHVGNVNNNELRLMLGLGNIGAQMQIELVDTIRGDDSYSNPRLAYINDQKITLVTRNTAKSRVVGGCFANDDAVDDLISKGVKVSEESPLTLRTLHTNSLRQILPDNVKVINSSEYFASIGQSLYQLVLSTSQEVVNRPLRRVDEQGKIREVSEKFEPVDIYGLGDDPNQGILPPLEAMMSIEIIKKLIDNNLGDSQIVHIAGPDMIKYTKQAEIMEPVVSITQKIASELGVPNMTNFEYIVPYMGAVIESEVCVVVADDIQSQYDVIAKASGYK